MKSKNSSGLNILALFVVIALFIYGQQGEKNDIDLDKLMPDDVEGFIEEGELVFIKTIKPDIVENNKSDYQTPQTPTDTDYSDNDYDKDYSYSNRYERSSFTTSEPESSSKPTSPPPTRSYVVPNKFDKKAQKTADKIQRLENKAKNASPRKQRKIRKKIARKEKKKGKQEACAKKKRAKRGF